MNKKIKELIIDKLGARLQISFARAGDDLQLNKLINESSPGTYVDIGSWHPRKASNSYYFYLRNWRGICIDPNPTLVPLYKKTRPKDIFVNAGIGLAHKNMTYYMFKESSMNTFNEDFIKENNLMAQLDHEISIPLIPLNELLNKYTTAHDRLDFFDIDVEGLDLEVLQSNDWNLYRPKIILIESNASIKTDIMSETTLFLETQHYRLLGKTIINGDLGNLIFINTQ